MAARASTHAASAAGCQSVSLCTLASTAGRSTTAALLPLLARPSLLARFESTKAPAAETDLAAPATPAAAPSQTAATPAAPSRTANASDAASPKLMEHLMLDSLSLNRRPVKKLALTDELLSMSRPGSSRLNSSNSSNSSTGSSTGSIGGSGLSSKLPTPATIFGNESFLAPKPLSEGPHAVHVTANRNNTLATLTTSDGKTLCWASAGTCGLKKAARGTSDAGYQAVLALTEKAKAKNVALNFGVHLRLKGFGPGRDQAFRAIRAAGWNIVRISDYTPYRHAGCRPKKKRRL